MELEKFLRIKEKYGFVASWACWASQSGTKAKDGIDDLEIFNINNPNNVLNDLHTKFVLVGLNISRADIDDEAWRNFHSPSPKATDYKLRYAISDSVLWGSYMTDLLKDFVEVDASKATRFFKQNPEKLSKHLEFFQEELNFVCENKPTLFALGGDTFQLLSECFGDKYKIVKLYHYASQIKLEALRHQYISSV